MIKVTLFTGNRLITTKVLDQTRVVIVIAQ
jgi:hypothetical protein